jgi:hypothetical protein
MNTDQLQEKYGQTRVEILCDHFYDMSKTELVEIILENMSQKEMNEWMKSIKEMIKGAI